MSGLGARANGLVVGITTAGDTNSVLLIDLYKTAHKAAEGDPTLERFGAFIFEAPEARVPEDDAELLRFLMAANPALASGRMDPDLFLADMRAKPAPDLLRYHLNRFTESLNAFLPLTMWGACTRRADAIFPRDRRPDICVDRSPGWEYATFTVAVKDEAGIVHTEVVASIVKPTPEQLLDISLQLAKHNPRSFAMDGFTLKTLAAELKKRGQRVHVLTQGDVIAASARFYALVQQQKLSHRGDPLLSVQMPNAVRKNVGDNYRISRKDTSVFIDGVLSTMGAVYIADVIPYEEKLQLF